MDITPKNGPKKTHLAAPKKAKPGAFFVGAAEGEGTREAPARHGKVRVSPATEVGASRLQRPVEIRGGRAAIYEEIRAGDEGAFLYVENHSLGEWFQRRLVPMMKREKLLLL